MQLESVADRFTDLALAVRIGGARYALPITAVEEVLPALPIESIPHGRQFLRGVVYVRDRFIPVLDVRERLGLASYSRPVEPYIVCLRVAGRLIGLEVDDALDLIDLREGVRLSGEEIGVRRRLFAGVVEVDGNVIRMLDPDQLLAEEETLALGPYDVDK